ncbi:Glucan endo-1,3-beta-glucosidase-like protein 1 [Quillaja saponaria]|uniref:Glucan endo-1,3-beta-glucosidase-like protein 1 n=1 Tax=Quillaja saponaria TaxID=32244 RepID=A0AAD7QHC0_QUISA|nr:Glucan endo-1,3-beta-glucosidase-like protein 1 [Quillaja saponaria]
MGKNFSFSLYLSLTLLTLFPFSYASIRRTSKAQTGGVPAVELWCVAKNNAEDAALQSALDWACGVGGADCSPIQQGGPCYDPSDIQNTASYAFNDYFLKHGLSDDSCYFDNTAAVTSLNPSHDNCRFPSSLKVSNGSFAGSATVCGIWI